MSGRDELFKGGSGDPGPFSFDERVVRVFPDMIDRSVPGYSLVVPMTAQLARRYARPDSVLYDLGCSLGATTLAMRQAVSVPGARIVAMDSSPAMVRGCRERLAASGEGLPVEVVEADVREAEVPNASVVAMNFTLQFVPPADRLPLLARIRQGLRPGGALVLSEKIRFDEPERQALQTTWHDDYKRARGYTDLEIAAKRAALERVLQADSEEAHRARLAAAGFSRVERWFQCFTFCSYLALA